MEGALRLTTNTQDRKQFGVALRSFQTLTQRAADMLRLARAGPQHELTTSHVAGGRRRRSDDRRPRQTAHRPLQPPISARSRCSCTAASA